MAKLFPVTIGNRASIKSLAEIVATESYEDGSSQRSFSVNYTTAPISLGNCGAIQPGKALICDTAWLSCSEMAQLQLSLNGSVDATLPSVSTRNMNPWHRGMLAWAHTGQLRNGMYGGAGILVKSVKDGVTGGTTIAVEGNFGVAGKLITDDFNFGADFIINIIGDSIAWGSGLLTKLDMWVFKLRNYYRLRGYNVRVRNWSISGSTMAQHANLFDHTRYDYNEPGITVIALGMNDALNSIPVATTQDSLLRILTGAKVRFPKQNKYVLAVTPTSKSGADETRAQATSDGLAATVSTFADPRVRYVVNTRTAFVANTTNLQNNGAQDNGVHPTATGHEGIFQSFKSYVDTPANNAFVFDS